MFLLLLLSLSFSIGERREGRFLRKLDHGRGRRRKRGAKGAITCSITPGCARSHVSTGGKLDLVRGRIQNVGGN